MNRESQRGSGIGIGIGNGSGIDFDLDFDFDSEFDLDSDSDTDSEQGRGHAKNRCAGRIPWGVLAPLGVLVGFGALLAVYLASARRSIPEPPPTAATVVPTPVTVVSDAAPDATVDPAEVFRRAFWKRPGAEDHILHADQQEWQDDEGRTRWQWSIAVRPGAGLKTYLASNPFALVAADTVVLADQPAWFPASAGGLDLQRSPASHLVHLWDPVTGVLYATDRGGGLHGAVARP